MNAPVQRHHKPGIAECVARTCHGHSRRYSWPVVLPAYCQVDHELDVTKLEVPASAPDPPGQPQVRGMAGPPPSPRIIDGPPVQNPLRVVLESVDQQNYKRGENIRYAIRLENVGTKPIPLPWTRDWRFAEPNRSEEHTSELQSL